jgi:methyltransferase-like protein
MNISTDVYFDASEEIELITAETETDNNNENYQTYAQTKLDIRIKV